MAKFSKIGDIKKYKFLLNHIKNFHKPTNNFKKNKNFLSRCQNFYKNKTYDRLSIFYKKFKFEDNDFQINNLKE